VAAYYNEIDPYAAQWLRNLIAAGHIAPGDVDERSIEDVRPEDIRGYTQCHFFAGVGVWSHALRRAGWADDRPVWTGSCPCQPFSAAGKGAGFDDERHLWPAWYHLISECKPPVILGEQVASKDADPWIDLVQDDLEALGYAFGAVPFPSASVGSPHIRDRTYWGAVGLADSNHKRLEGRRGMRQRPAEIIAGACSLVSWMADSQSLRCEGKLLRARSGLPQDRIAQDSISGRMANPRGERFGRWEGIPQRSINDGAHAGWVEGDNGAECDDEAFLSRIEQPGPTNGYWRDVDWLGCRDGKWRPVEPGTFPLAHGVTARVGRLRAYGNAINAEQAKIFIETVMEDITPLEPIL
jgi:DNA (cytosine-5)-methyltransferase 1